MDTQKRGRGRPRKSDDEKVSKTEAQRRYRAKKKAEGKTVNNAIYVDEQTAELIALTAEALNKPKASIYRVVFAAGLQALCPPMGEEREVWKSFLKRIIEIDAEEPSEQEALIELRKFLTGNFELTEKVLVGQSGGKS
ncbi:hypothetical protein [Neptuniibacter sp.]|uniref:hypothetical protein n=1 Tax=Neptuniibacter sp. TaxID=1962643 RepID=UPI00262A6CA2|nr:hypothetical protein [Neptuniibacter sp.]MCP4597191.1 hypothetical protein [Neptuniibacter sp.]